MTTNDGSPTPTGYEAPPATMQAIVQDRYGGPGVLRLETVATPEPGHDQILIRVVAASLNVYDLHMISGMPLMVRAMAGVTKPKQRIPGADLAGVVVAVGRDVEQFSPGDEVFGEVGGGALAEYTVAKERHIRHKPSAIDFPTAAAIPMAGLTALQGLRDVGGLQAGQRVLVNGASGGVGTFAVQIAKALGAEVTAVCSTPKVAQARAIGADRVIDYTSADYTVTERDYDLLFDNAGNRGWRRTSRVLRPGGVNVTITGPKHAVAGPLRNLLIRKIAAAFSDKRIAWFTARVDATDLETLATMAADGRVTPVVERTYPFGDVAAALGYLQEGHAHGKLVISVGDA